MIAMLLFLSVSRGCRPRARPWPCQLQSSNRLHSLLLLLLLVFFINIIVRRKNRERGGRPFFRSFLPPQTQTQRRRRRKTVGNNWRESRGRSLLNCRHRVYLLGKFWVWAATTRSLPSLSLHFFCFSWGCCCFSYLWSWRCHNNNNNWNENRFQRTDRARHRVLHFWASWAVGSQLTLVVVEECQRALLAYI